MIAVDCSIWEDVIKLFNPAIAETFPAIGSTTDVPNNEKLVVIKFHHASDDRSWFGIEYDSAVQCFSGFVFGPGDKPGQMGSFSVEELEALGAEPDRSFNPAPLLAVLSAERRERILRYGYIVSAVGAAALSPG